MAGTILGFRRFARTAAPLAAGCLALAGVAQAQSMSTNSASFNPGYGRTADQENSPVNVQTGDTTLISGMVTGAEPSSIFAGGAIDNFSGAGGGAATPIGDNLSVVTLGDNNVVIVTSTHSTADASANANVNGKP
jgi:holdfast attachment protein HfaA